MAHRCIRLILNVHEWSWMIMHESRTAHLDNSMWMLVTLSFALLCCAWSTSDGDVPGWSECCCRDVWLGGHGKILQSDDSLIVLIPYSLPKCSSHVKALHDAGHMAATANQRACGRIRIPWRGSRGEADRRDQRLLIPSSDRSIFYLLFARFWKYVFCYFVNGFPFFRWALWLC